MLTLAEAAEMFGLQPAALRRACWQGRIQAVKKANTWFVKSREVEAALAGGMIRKKRRTE